jgi:Clp amino terminal domain, pathogenicity island component/ClpX C4-type zinc finger
VFERFTDRARRVVVLAQEEARLLDHNYIGTEHILLGLIHEGEGVAARALESLDISLDDVRAEVEEIIGRGSEMPSGHIPFTPRAKKVLELALREALQLGHNYIGTEHVLLGLIREGEGVAAQVLVKLGADLSRVRQQVIQVLSGYAGTARTPDPLGAPPLGGPARVGQPVCSFCGRDLWEAAHYVRGEVAMICDECVAAATTMLSEAQPDQHALLLPVRIFGTEPEPGAADAIVDAIVQAFDLTDAAHMLACVEDGADFVEETERLLAQRPDHLPSLEARVDRIRFSADDRAVVRITRSVGEVVAEANEIRVVCVDGRWLVSRNSFTHVLAAMILRHL